MTYHRYLAVLLLALSPFFLSACDSGGGGMEEEEEETTETLRELAEARGIAIGAAAETNFRDIDQRYSTLLAREFNMVTAGNAMKFGPLRPSRNTFNFNAADALIDFAEANDMQVRGHTLLWHNQNPDWLNNGNFSRDEMIEIMREHITTVVGRYRGRIVAWDVVNEAIADNGQLRNTIWLQTIGPEYIEMAFEFAHEADPQALLFYNDYNAEGSGTKSDAVYNLVRDLRQRGIPIHGVGLQMHVTVGFSPTAASVLANMQRLEALNLYVHITEMDVRMPVNSSGVPLNSEDLTQQAGIYLTMMDVCLTALNCTAFVIWGFTDQYSWIPSTFEGQGAALIFDSNYQPKPAYQWLADALRDEG